MGYIYTPQYKIEQFTSTGRLMLEPEELFREASWFSVLVGQNHMPRDYSPLLDAESTSTNAQALSEQRRVLASAVAAIPMHADTLKRIVNAKVAKARDVAIDERCGLAARSVVFAALSTRLCF